MQVGLGFPSCYYPMQEMLSLFSAARYGLLLVLVLALAGCGTPRSRHVRSVPPPPPDPVMPSPEPVHPGNDAPEISAASALLSLPVPILPQDVPLVLPPREIPPAPDDPLKLFGRHVFHGSGGQKLPYRLLKPWNFEPDKDYPLVVFLHGSRARGTDNRRHLNGSSESGISLWTSNDVQRDYPSFVLAPQAKTTWVRSWAFVERPANRREPLELVVELIESLKGRHNIDPRRIYISGVSMGGFGVWGAITRHPTLFAGAVAVCGGGNPRMVKPNPTPVWVFHGSRDTVVSPRRSREMVAALRRVGGNVRYTEYKGVRHDSWKLAFKEAELVPWLFSQKL